MPLPQVPENAEEEVEEIDEKEEAKVQLNPGFKEPEFREIPLTQLMATQAPIETES